MIIITTIQPDTESNPNRNHNPTAKQHAIVNIQLDIVSRPTYPEKFIRDNVMLFTTFGCDCHFPAQIHRRCNYTYRL